MLGEELHTSDGAEIQQVILTRLLDQHAAQNEILVTDVEIAAYVEGLQRAIAADLTLIALARHDTMLVVHDPRAMISGDDNGF